MSKLESLCPPKVRYALRGMFDESYDLVNKLYTDVKWLSRTDVCKNDVRTHILRGAIAWVAKIFCEKGTLPYTFSESLNTVSNCAHVELYGTSSIILLCRVEHSGALPTYSIFRNNYTEYYNMDSLFPEYYRESEIKYLAATYGDNGTPAFQYGRIGIPGKRKWIDWKSLDQGPYRTFITKHEKDDLLVGIREQLEEVNPDGK